MFCADISMQINKSGAHYHEINNPNLLIMQLFMYFIYTDILLFTGMCQG